jgi:hypothetical protein
MGLTKLDSRQLLMEFGHVMQQCLFTLETELGEMSPQLRRIASVMAMAPVQAHLSGAAPPQARPSSPKRHSTCRPPAV